MNAKFCDIEIPRSPLDIPERKIGKFSIRHQYRESDDLVTMREAILTGQRAVTVNYTEPMRIHQLCEGESLWMSDRLCELKQSIEDVGRLAPFGKVLVGGLGLGISPTLISKMEDVDEVAIVEKSRSVIRLTGGQLNARCHVICADIHKYVRELTIGEFDCAYLDTWAGTGESTWWDDVVPLRRALGRAGLKPQRVVCWAEEIMLGQVIDHLCFEGGQQMGLTWKPHWWYRMDRFMSRDEATTFCRTVGSPEWEEKWGIIYPYKVK